MLHAEPTCLAAQPAQLYRVFTYYKILSDTPMQPAAHRPWAAAFPELL